MSKPSQSHLTTAQRIYDRLGRGSVADIDAIAQALAEASEPYRSFVELCASGFFIQDDDEIVESARATLDKAES